MCDFERAKISLPAGYSWSKDEHIFNTNGISNAKYGGEINTPPLRLCHKDMADIHGIYHQLKETGGRVKWVIDTHVHIYSGDLTLDEVKSIFYLLYHCYPYVKKYCNIPEWDEYNTVAKPIPTKEKYERVKNAENWKQLDNALANQSNKHYLRYAFNVASHFVRKTIEFRCFHATQDMELLKNCVLSSYRMFEYAISHTEKDFMSISSYDEFVSKLKLPKTGTPPTLVPLLYQGNRHDKVCCYYSANVGFNRKMLKALLQQGITEVAVVGDGSLLCEKMLADKVKLTIYNQSSWVNALYLISKGVLDIHFTNNLEWLEKYNNGTKERLLSICMYVGTKVRKYIGRRNEYEQLMFSSYESKAEESIITGEESSKKLISFFEKVQYKVGNLNDAIKNEKCVYFQFGADKHTKSAYGCLKRNSDIDAELESKPNEYYEIIENIPSGHKFYMFSDSVYLSNMRKAAMITSNKKGNDGKILYTNVGESPQSSNVVCIETSAESVNVDIKEPPYDLVIDDYRKLRIVKTLSSHLFSLQKRYIKKVDEMKPAMNAFLVMYEDYCLGGFGFKLPQAKGVDLWQLTDFCTNNDIPRLAKLILMCILSKQTKRTLSRVMGHEVKKVITYVYTSNPVSMKYRGIYKKDKENSVVGRLIYIGEFGKYNDMKDIVDNYQKQIKK